MTKAFYHAGEMLEAMNNAARKREIEENLEAVLPLLSPMWVSAPSVDFSIACFIKDEVPEGDLPLRYSELHEHDMGPELTCGFMLSEVMGMPALTTYKDRQEPSYEQSLDEIADQQLSLVEEIRGLGCKTIGCHLRRAEVGERDGMELRLRQWTLFVPNRRIERLEDGSLSTSPNTEDQVIFLKHLIDKEYIDPQEHRDMIINAFSMRVLHLAQQRKAGPKALQP